jgi:hypothetical protein
MPADHDLGTALVEVDDDCIGVERFARDQTAKANAIENGSTPVVSNRCLGGGSKCTRVANALVSASIPLQPGSVALPRVAIRSSPQAHANRPMRGSAPLLLRVLVRPTNSF